MSRFEGNGLSFKAKLIGVEDVPEARGDQMCQDALLKLKNAVRVSGEHKQKIFVNVTLEGLKIVDAISLVRMFFILELLAPLYISLFCFDPTAVKCLIKLHLYKVPMDRILDISLNLP